MRLVELRAWAGELVSSDAEEQTSSERFVELNDDIQKTRLQLSDVEARTLGIQGHSFTEQDVANALRKLDPIWNELFSSA